MQYKTKAEQIAHGLIQSYIGPDHKVIDMRGLLWGTRRRAKSSP